MLCGVDVPAHVQGAMRAIVALQRTGEDAPRNLCLIARNVLPSGERRAAVVRKVVHGTEAQTIGIEVPMGEAGEHMVEFSVAECTDEGNIEIFHIPARCVNVGKPEQAEVDDSFSEPEFVDKEDEDEAELVAAPVVAEKVVSLKVGFHLGSATEASVIRRLAVTMGLDCKNRYVEPLQTVMQVLTRAFRSELDASAPAPVLCYNDEYGARVEVCSDLQLVAALGAPAKGGVMRLSLHQ